MMQVVTFNAHEYAFDFLLCQSEYVVIRLGGIIICVFCCLCCDVCCIPRH